MEIKIKSLVANAIVTDTELTISKKTMSVDDVKEIRYCEPTFLMNGFLFFATEQCPGKDVSSIEPAMKYINNTIVFKKKQKDDMHKIMEFFTDKVPIVEAMSAFIDEGRELKNQDILYCPRCHSTQIFCGSESFNMGRAVVGGALFGAAGAAIGGVTGKKLEFKCMKCGHTWKK